jgi:trehalose 6-phosphate phosphatase
MPKQLKEELAEILGRKEKGAAALYLDFDGTLTPAAPEPSEVLLDSSVRRALTTISRMKGVVVGVISGRALADLQRRVGIEGLVYAGNHGMEIVGKRLRFVDSAAVAAADELQEVSKQLLALLWRIPGIRIEEKRLSVAVHYRLVSSSRLFVVRGAVERAIAPYLAKLRLLPGNKSIEILPRTSWNKGAAVLWINHRRGIGEEGTIYIGDDVTDEDAFRVLQDGVTIRVGGTSTRTGARFALNNPAEVSRLLESIAYGRT